MKKTTNLKVVVVFDIEAQDPAEVLRQWEGRNRFRDDLREEYVGKLELPNRDFRITGTACNVEVLSSEEYERHAINPENPSY